MGAKMTEIKRSLIDADFGIGHGQVLRDEAELKVLTDRIDEIMLGTADIDYSAWPR